MTLILAIVLAVGSFAPLGGVDTANEWGVTGRVVFDDSGDNHITVKWYDQDGLIDSCIVWESGDDYSISVIREPNGLTRLSAEQSWSANIQGEFGIEWPDDYIESPVHHWWHFKAFIW